MKKAPPNSKSVCCTVECYDQMDPGAYISLLCEGYKLTGSFTLKEIADFVRVQQNDYPDDILFAILDDEGQAAYTCMHSRNKHDLDNIDGHDLSNLPPSAFEEHNGKKEHKGYLSLVGEFPIRHKNFMSKANKVDLSSLSKQLIWDEEDCVTVLTSSDLSSLPREQLSFVQIVPVKTPPEALSAYPNGYFTSDLDPFQNYVLAKYILDEFGIRLFGIGATYLGFMMDDPLEEIAAKELGKFLVTLIRGDSDDRVLVQKLALLLTGESEFYLAYASG